MGLHLEMLKLPLALLFIVVGLAYGTKYSPPSNGPRSTRTRYKSRNVPGNVDLGSIRLPGVAKPLTLRIKVLPAPNPSEPNEPQSSRNTSLEQRDHPDHPDPLNAADRAHPAGIMTNAVLAGARLVRECHPAGHFCWDHKDCCSGSCMIACL